MREFERRDNESWRDVVSRIATRATEDDPDNASDFIRDCLNTFARASSNRQGKNDRVAALVALHRWACFPCTEHTPGPWTWEKVDDSVTMLLGEGQDVCCASILIVEGCEACATRGRNCSMNGNAYDFALIEAAPDLLAACKAFLTEWADFDGYDEAANAVILARAAIAKAEKINDLRQKQESLGEELSKALDVKRGDLHIREDDHPTLVAQILTRREREAKLQKELLATAKALRDAHDENGRLHSRLAGAAEASSLRKEQLDLARTKISHQRCDIAELKATLMIFVMEYDGQPDNVHAPDSQPIHSTAGLQYGDLRRARKLLDLA